MSLAPFIRLPAVSIISISFGILVFAVLSYFMILPKISIPISAAMFILILGVTTYYLGNIGGKKNYPGYQETSEIAETNSSANVEYTKSRSLYFIFFVLIYTLLLTVSSSSSMPTSSLFENWNEIGQIGFIQLSTAIMITFFMPGYALTYVIFKKYELNPLLKILLAYLISMLITGTIAYVLGLYLDFPVSESKYIIIGINVLILVALLVSYPLNMLNQKGKATSRKTDSNRLTSFLSNLSDSVKIRMSELLVFASIFLLLILSTYYLFGGATIGDQWFHQGRSVLFLSGSIRDAALFNVDYTYPPFQSALTSGLTALSGLPVTNTYSAIAFLNITFIFAFYYFLSKWLPLNMQRAKILATTLFAISSGFGWIYLLGLTVTNHTIISENSVIQMISSMESFDIFQPTNFFLASHPDFSTGLIYIVLPAGFIILALLRVNFRRNSTFFIIVTMISLLGILTHDEFYLFIIIGSVLPLFFSLKHGNQFYPSILLSLLIVFIIDVLNPLKYYTSTEIFGLPLLYLNALFVGITWLLYLVKQNIKTLAPLKSRYYKFTKKKLSVKHKIGLKFLGRILTVAAVSYVYGLSFIVLFDLAIDDVNVQSAGYGDVYNVPWYLYPMKFGITGVVGLAFLVSYIFKKFEKQVFVFGILILISLFAGPYYDEHRFSKYIMAGFAACAAILIWQIIDSLKRQRMEVVYALAIGAIITVAGMSSLLYIGYNSLILQTQEFVQTLGRRNFDSVISEIGLYQTIHDKINISSGRYNIAAFPNEYQNLEDGLTTKLQAFSGLPYDAIRENSLILNVSTLDSFYHLLDKTGTRFIIVPKGSVENDRMFSDPLRFALNNFPQAYEDDRYLVLDVPDLSSPSPSENGIAMIFDPKQTDRTSLSNDFPSKLLHYDNKSFDFAGITNFVVMQKRGETSKIILSDYISSGGLTIWSREMNPKEGINYMEIEFKVLSEKSKKYNNLGLKWKEKEDEEFYLSISKDGLQLYKKSGLQGQEKVVFQNLEVETTDSIPYTLKLERLQNSLNVYLNNVLRIKIPQNSSIDNLGGITKVGITASNNIVEYGQLRVASISESIYENKNNFIDFYYPLSVLALSKNQYDLYTDNDFSPLSKKRILLTFDPLTQSEFNYDRYLQYAKNGGMLIVLDSDNSKGKFSQLLLEGIKNGKDEHFTRIADNSNQMLNISGQVRQMEINRSKDVMVLSSYQDMNGKSISPFAIAKNFTGGGKIILINSKPYFEAISNSSGSNISFISNVSKLMLLEPAKNENTITKDAHIVRFIGGLQMAGDATLESSSLIMNEDPDNPLNLNAESISISSKNGTLIKQFHNVTISDFKLIGAHEATIHSLGAITFPHMDSRHGYVRVSLPTRSNLTIHLPLNNASSVEMEISSESNSTSIASKNSIMEIRKLGDPEQGKTVEVLMKRPVITLTGILGFKGSNIDPYYTNNEIPIDSNGTLQTKIDFVDNYQYSNGQETWMKFLTYLDSMSAETTVKEDIVRFNAPGDISPVAKEKGIKIPLQESFLTVSNLVLVLLVSALTLIVSWVEWPKFKLRTSGLNS